MKIAYDENCKTEWLSLKMDSAHRYIIYRIEKKESERIVLESIGERDKTWDDFKAALPAEDYRYGIFDLQFTTGDGRHIYKPFFLFWAPDAAPLMKRMLYATAKENFKTELDLLGKDVTICSKDELTFDQLCKEFDK